MRNQGGGFADDFHVTVYLDLESNPIWTPSFAGIEAGQSAAATFTWAAQAGPHTFRAVADGREEIAETNESNNDAIVIYDATQLADLLITDLTRNPQNPSAGETVVITVTVRNDGQGATKDFFVHVYLDDDPNPRWRLSISGIEAGQSAATTFTWTAVAGAHSFKAVADGRQEIPETTTANNELTVSFP